jgi:hypothetical protein
MRQRGLSSWYNSVGYTAAQSCCLWHLIRMEEFAQDGPVNNAFMRTVGDITDEHGRISGDFGAKPYMYTTTVSLGKPAFIPAPYTFILPYWHH